MKILIGLLLFVLLGAKLIGVLFPEQGSTVPVSSVAPEVCQYNGHIVPPVTKTDGLLYVECSSGTVQVVKP